tara:strand:- start:1689 stop:2408 length:720 start_codon:yes stop_codon:yes gene_type:complete
MIVYGRRSVIEAISSDLEIQKAFIKKNAVNMEKIIFKLNKKNIPISFVPIEKLKKLTSNNHQGIVCQISKIKTFNLNDLDSYLQNKDSSRLAFLDGITDTKNFGSIIRNAECFGIDGIIISKTGSAQINDETIKSSSGAIFNIPIYKVDHLMDAIFLVKEQNFVILGADEKSKKQLKSLKFKNKTIIILGSEGKGISSPVLKKCDETFKIPLLGNIESLNVSVAAGIIMYEISKAKSKE